MKKQVCSHHHTNNKMSANCWAAIVVDGDLVTPPVRFFAIDSDFDRLTANVFDYMEKKIYPAANGSDSESDGGTTTNKHTQEMAAFRANIDKVRDGGYLMSISGTICVDIKPIHTSLSVVAHRAQGIELDDVVRQQKAKRARKDK